MSLITLNRLECIQLAEEIKNVWPIEHVQLSNNLIINCKLFTTEKYTVYVDQFPDSDLVIVHRYGETAVAKNDFIIRSKYFSYDPAKCELVEQLFEKLRKKILSGDFCTQCEVSSALHLTISNWFRPTHRKVEEHSLEFWSYDEKQNKTLTGLPPEFKMSMLKREDAAVLSAAWTLGHKLHDQTKRFEETIVKMPTLAIRCVTNEKLAGWILFDTTGIIHHLYVKQEFRGKGLARVLIERLPADIIRKGLIPQLLITAGNEASQKLFQSMSGWKNSQNTQFSFLVYSKMNTKNHYVTKVMVNTGYE